MSKETEQNSVSIFRGRPLSAASSSFLTKGLLQSTNKAIYEHRVKHKENRGKKKARDEETSFVSTSNSAVVQNLLNGELVAQLELDPARLHRRVDADADRRIG